MLFCLGVPEAPEQPLVKEVTKDSALVLWNRPRDGGKPIFAYIVEKKETMATRWTKVSREPIYPDTQLRVTDLLEGCEYEFRVSAENEIGIGDPSPPSKPVFANDPIGMSILFVLLANQITIYTYICLRSDKLLVVAVITYERQNCI